MQILLHNIKVRLEEDGPAAYKKLAADKLRLDISDVSRVTVFKKSLDARDKRQFFYNLSLAVKVPSKYRPSKKFPRLKEAPPKKEPKNILPDRPIIVGFGPAGMFAALTFLAYGIKPVVFERGKKVEERLLDIRKFEQERTLDPESNVQFGEGGAGTYSDGKLTTRIKETGYVANVLETFIQHGAPAEIAYLNKPHLGTDQLRAIVKNIREHIVKSGGEINFQSKVTDFIVEGDTLKGVIVDGQKHFSATVILAIGHSARDTFQLLKAKGVGLEQKPFAVGARIEHPAELINLMQYGEKYQNHSKLGPAEYALAAGGVYSFCMCPGGEVVNASSESGKLALNGMSNSKRDGRFSNAAIVAAVSTEDFGSGDPLAGIEFQRQMEAKAYHDGWGAPAQNLLDFLSATKSSTIMPGSYKMGMVSAELNKILPEFISSKLAAAFKQWGERFPLFISARAVLLLPETRTSSPVRILRQQNRQSISFANLYPVGEGAGYAGGITSSAVDAIKTVESILGIS
ncbi:MAG: dehydrogenase [Candidatus Saganbacteria bacterium]|nr:dehydrogenase [Candidatus Saganbacteria bacterium]